MRILKNKITAASSNIDFRASNLNVLPTQTLESLKIKKVVVKLDGQPDRRKRKKKRKNPMRRKILATKNILKNFGRAIANFASSQIALPYIQNTEEWKAINQEDFNKYALGTRDYIQNIDTFRDCFLIKEDDVEEEKNLKRLFQKAGLAFMKYFAVNWIFSGKIEYKLEYLKYRGKILRRIQNPDAFVSLKPNQTN